LGKVLGKWLGWPINLDQQGLLLRLPLLIGGTPNYWLEVQPKLGYYFPNFWWDLIGGIREKNPYFNFLFGGYPFLLSGN